MGVIKVFRKDELRTKKDAEPKQLEKLEGEFSMTAKTMAGLEELLVQELIDLGAKKVEKGVRSATFEGDLKLMYKANLHLRTALRVLVPIDSFKASNEDELYNEIRRINWSDYLGVDGSLMIDSFARSETFRNTQYLSQKVKDAIVDQFRDKYRKRPNVDKFKQDLRVNIYCKDDEFIVSLDSSGDSLHRRGYKLVQGPAPISEVLAAGMILLSGWDKQTPFIDPMCGSGTIVLEAALMARNIPAGNFRKEFGFQRWPNYNKALWDEIKEEANAAIKPKADAPIYANELHKGGWRQARENIGTSGLRRDIELSQGDFFEMPSSAKSGVLIINPPYGERLEETDIEGMYSNIGDAFKKNWDGWTCWILSSNTTAMKNIGLKSTIKIPLFNGKLECRFVKYEMYKGSKED